MDLGIRGKVALVTGASAGLGFAAATALAEEGARVAINSRSADNLKKAADSIHEKTGIRPTTIEGDLTHEGAAEKMVKTVSGELGSIDILVSNAGGPPAGQFMQISKEAWNSSLDLTFLPAVDLTRAVLPGMQEKKWGRIIFITSISVKQPVDNLIISNALRAGVTGFAKSISNEFARDGITVNTVCPGYTETERLKELATVKAEISGNSIEDIFSNWINEVPARRLGRPPELAALIAFLCSERAAYITGTSILVDGGLYKGLL